MSSPAKPSSATATAPVRTSICSTSPKLVSVQQALQAPSEQPSAIASAGMRQCSHTTRIGLHDASAAAVAAAASGTSWSLVNVSSMDTPVNATIGSAVSTSRSMCSRVWELTAKTRAKRGHVLFATRAARCSARAWPRALSLPDAALSPCRISHTSGAHAHVPVGRPRAKRNTSAAIIRRPRH
eukprot:4610219-Prymnesium_polylepis.1